MCDEPVRSGVPEAGPVQTAFPRLFQPQDIGPIRVRNRIVSTAHATSLIQEGVPSDADRSSFARRARGGVALQVTEGTAVHPASVAGSTIWPAYEPKIVPALAALGACVRAAGGVDGTVRLWDTSNGVLLHALRAERRYEGFDITGLTGVTEAQRRTLLALGAVEGNAPPPSGLTG